MIFENYLRGNLAGQSARVVVRESGGAFELADSIVKNARLTAAFFGRRRLRPALRFSNAVNNFVRNIAQCVVRQDERIGDQNFVVGEDFGETNSRENLNGEDFLKCFLELEQGHRFTAAKIDDPHAAIPFLNTFGDRDAAEHGAFTHLREADKRVRPAEIKSPGEAGKFDERLVSSAREINRADRPRA